MYYLFGVFLGTALGGLCIYCALEACRNVWLHPLSGFPGPKLAAASQLWQAYHELVRGEKQTDLLARLHSRYGGVVRHGPNCIHFSQPQAFFEIYNRKWDKDPVMYNLIVEPEATPGVLAYEDFKPRRDVVYSYYARRNVILSLPAINRQIGILVQKLGADGQQGRFSNLYLALRCLTQDINAERHCGLSTGQMEAPAFQGPLLAYLDTGFAASRLYRCIPWLSEADGAISMLSPDFRKGNAMVERAASDIKALLEHQHQEGDFLDSSVPQFTLLQHLADRTKNGTEKLTKTQILGELLSFYKGAAESVARTLTLCMHRLLQSPQQPLLKQLRSEIGRVWPCIDSTPPDLQALERLPLLMATLKEGLRLVHAVVSPAPRLVPANGATIDGHHVPGGTRVGMSTLFVHMNPEIFPDPDRFDPKRWMGKEATGLDQYLVAFSKGPRACAGASMAWVILCYTLAALIRKLEFEYRAEMNDEVLEWKDCFEAWFCGRPVVVRCLPISEDK